jgi:hypothetical protein
MIKLPERPLDPPEPTQEQLRRADERDDEYKWDFNCTYKGLRDWNKGLRDWIESDVQRDDSAVRRVMYAALDCQVSGLTDASLSDLMHAVNHAREAYVRWQRDNE